MKGEPSFAWEASEGEGRDCFALLAMTDGAEARKDLGMGMVKWFEVERTEIEGVFVRPLSWAETEAFTEARKVSAGKGSGVVLAAGLVDGDGKPLFEDGAAALAGVRPFARALALFERILEVSGMGTSPAASSGIRLRHEASAGQAPPGGGNWGGAGRRDIPRRFQRHPLRRGTWGG